MQAIRNLFKEYSILSYGKFGAVENLICLDNNNLDIFLYYCGKNLQNEHTENVTIMCFFSASPYRRLDTEISCSDITNSSLYNDRFHLISWSNISIEVCYKRK